MHFWNNDAFATIGNSLGKYHVREDPKNNFYCARICVEADLEEGLPTEIKINLNGWIHVKSLDYDQLLFKCRHYHIYKHFVRNYPTKEPPKETQ